MAKYRLTSPSGETFEVTAPDDAPPDAVMSFAKQQWAQMQAPKQPTAQQTADASVGSRMATGFMDPFVGGAQLMANALPQKAADALGGAFGNAPVTSEDVNRYVTQREQRIEDARKATGQTGVDWARMAGVALNPTNILPWSAASNLGRAALGAASGVSGGALQPVANAEEKGYWGQKLAQTGLGAAAGGVLGPVIGKVGDVIATKVTNVVTKSERVANAPVAAERMIREALAETGQKIDDIPADALTRIKADVTTALAQGKELNAAQLARLADFDRLGIKPLSGQITRDAGEFSNQYNLARSGAVGEPIRQRLAEQNRQLTEQIGAMGARDAGDALQAGQSVTGALSAFDERFGKAVGAKYAEARATAGIEDSLPMQGLAQDFESVRRKFGDQNIPGAVRSFLEEFGATGGKQTRVFTPRDAEELIQIINANADPAKKAEFAALGVLRTAVKRTVEEAPTGDVFSEARKLASARFKLHDAIPAIQAAADGSVPPDTFVQKFIIGNRDSGQVIGLGKVLAKESPEALGEARNQVGAHLFRSAFGENMAGDAAFAPERFAKALRDLGDAKLSAFYSPEQIADLKALARVGAYINKLPAAHSANTSNSANRLLDLVQQVPGAGTALTAISPFANAAARGLGALADAATKGKQVQAALNPQAASAPAALPPAAIELRNFLVRALPAGGAAAISGSQAGRSSEQ